MVSSNLQFYLLTITICIISPAVVRRRLKRQAIPLEHVQVHSLASNITVHADRIEARSTESIVEFDKPPYNLTLFSAASASAFDARASFVRVNASRADLALRMRDLDLRCISAAARLDLRMNPADGRQSEMRAAFRGHVRFGLADPRSHLRLVLWNASEATLRSKTDQPNAARLLRFGFNNQSQVFKVNFVEEDALVDVDIRGEVIHIVYGSIVIQSDAAFRRLRLLTPAHRLDFHTLGATFQAAIGERSLTITYPADRIRVQLAPDSPNVTVVVQSRSRSDVGRTDGLRLHINGARDEAGEGAGVERLQLVAEELRLDLLQGAGGAGILARGNNSMLRLHTNQTQIEMASTAHLVEIWGEHPVLLTTTQNVALVIGGPSNDTLPVPQINAPQVNYTNYNMQNLTYLNASTDQDQWLTSKVDVQQLMNAPMAPVHDFPPVIGSDFTGGGGLGSGDGDVVEGSGELAPPNGLDLGETWNLPDWSAASLESPSQPHESVGMGLFQPPDLNAGQPEFFPGEEPNLSNVSAPQWTWSVLGGGAATTTNPSETDGGEAGPSTSTATPSDGGASTEASTGEPHKGEGGEPGESATAPEATAETTQVPLEETPTESTQPPSNEALPTGETSQSPEPTMPVETEPSTTSPSGEASQPAGETPQPTDEVPQPIGEPSQPSAEAPPGEPPSPSGSDADWHFGTVDANSGTNDLGEAGKVSAPQGEPTTSTAIPVGPETTPTPGPAQGEAGGQMEHGEVHEETGKEAVEPEGPGEGSGDVSVTSTEAGGKDTEGQDRTYGPDAEAVEEVTEAEKVGEAERTYEVHQEGHGEVQQSGEGQQGETQHGETGSEGEGQQKPEAQGEPPEGSEGPSEAEQGQTQAEVHKGEEQQTETSSATSGSSSTEEPFPTPPPIPESEGEASEDSFPVPLKVDVPSGSDVDKGFPIPPMPGASEEVLMPNQDAMTPAQQIDQTYDRNEDTFAIAHFGEEKSGRIPIFATISNTSMVEATTPMFRLLF